MGQRKSEDVLSAEGRDQPDHAFGNPTRTPDYATGVVRQVIRARHEAMRGNSKCPNGLFAEFAFTPPLGQVAHQWRRTLFAPTVRLAISMAQTRSSNLRAAGTHNLRDLRDVGDVDGDGDINIIDATEIQRYIVQLIPSLG